MISFGQASSMDENISKLKEGFDIHAWLLEYYEKQIADPQKWADVGISEYLNRRDEADEHNAPFIAARDKKRKQYSDERENEYKVEKEKTLKNTMRRSIELSMLSVAKKRSKTIISLI